MEETKKDLVSSLRRYKGTLTFDTIDPDQGLIYIYTGEKEGITLQVIQRGRPELPVVTYLRACTETWVDHDTLRLEFSEEEVWEALRLGYLKPLRTLRCYSIETDKLG